MSNWIVGRRTSEWTFFRTPINNFTINVLIIRLLSESFIQPSVLKFHPSFHNRGLKLYLLRSHNIQIHKQTHLGSTNSRIYKEVTNMQDGRTLKVTNCTDFVEFRVTLLAEMYDYRFNIKACQKVTM